MQILKPQMQIALFWEKLNTVAKIG